MRTLCISLLASVFLGSVHAGIPQPTSQQLRDYMRELEHLEKTFFADQRKGDQFGEHFWRESKRVGGRTGPNVIATILPYATKRKWTGEEGLICVPLVAMLPRQPTLKILRAYERSHFEPEHTLGREYLTGLEAEDTQAGVMRYTK